MTEAKSWYRSRTIWGALVAVGAALANLAGTQIDPAAGGELADALTALGVAAGAVLAILGRIGATSRIG